MFCRYCAGEAPTANGLWLKVIGRGTGRADYRGMAMGTGSGERDCGIFGGVFGSVVGAYGTRLGVRVVVLVTTVLLDLSARALTIRRGLEVGELPDPCRKVSTAMSLAIWTPVRYCIDREALSAG